MYEERLHAANGEAREKPREISQCTVIGRRFDCFGVSSLGHTVKPSYGVLVGFVLFAGRPAPEEMKRFWRINKA